MWRLFILPLLLIPANAIASDRTFGLDVETIQILEAQEAFTEASIQQDGLPEFRFIRDPNSIPERLDIVGPFVDVPISLDARLAERMERASLPSLVATLHNIETGEPLQSCAAPCVLDRLADETVFLILYRFGGQIQFVELPTQDSYLPTILSRMSQAFNAADDAVKRAECQARGDAKRSQSLSTDAELCFGITPPLPPSARRSGHCIVDFDVTAEGLTENIRARECTEFHFCKSSALSVVSSHYVPKIELHAFVAQTGLERTIRYTVKDQYDRLLPEPEGLLVSCNGTDLPVEP